MRGLGVEIDGLAVQGTLEKRKGGKGQCCFDLLPCLYIVYTWPLSFSSDKAKALERTLAAMSEIGQERK